MGEEEMVDGDGWISDDSSCEYSSLLQGIEFIADLCFNSSLR
jgi:hypothetical protein